ncbi:hypothetical protein C8R44DRAFT_776523 [Mycena epipterygia]|nr:hypothetical protein C8R44DRAFT_776523 [Mycena epipterygia]
MAFPTELWRMAWSHASPKDLKTLASSCRMFRDMCQPLLFENISLAVPFPEAISPITCKELLPHMKRSHDRLLSITSSTHIPAMVRCWSFQSSQAELDDLDDSHPLMRDAGTKEVVEVSCAINSLFNSTIGLYTNLSRLILMGFNFSPQFSQTLMSLPKLAAMHIVDCVIVFPISGSGVALQEFSYSHRALQWKDDIAEQYNLVSPSKLAQLDLFEPVPARAFLSFFAVSEPLPHLVSATLALSYDARDVFYRFLDCCPQLKCLDITAPVGFSVVPLPETSIPELVTFKGPIELVGIFSAGRPVRKVKVNHTATEWEDDDVIDDSDEGPVDKTVLQEALLQMSRSTATLEDITLLSVPLDSSLLRLISEIFPKLKRLVFFLRNTEESPSEPHPDQESEEEGDQESQGEGDWETVAGSEVGDDDIGDVPDVDQMLLSEAGAQGLALTLLRDLLNVSAQNIDQNLPESDGHHCDGCDDCSESSETSESIDWPEDEASRTYDDLKLDSFEHFMSSLGNDCIPLPRNLRCLGIGQIPRAFNEKYMSDADISSVVEKLGARYPRLSKVIVGIRARAWKRKGGVWKPPNPEPPMKPIHFQMLDGFLTSFG